MADKKSYRNIQFRKRTKRQQLITPTASLTSLLSGSTTSINASAAATATATATATTTATASTASPSNDSNRSSKKNKMGKKVDKDKPPRERWLLTRKTWKYMTDAGRRLIPEYIRGNGSDPQELKKIEEYFQQVCRSEPKFLPIFRRKQSFPGAMGPTPFRRSGRLRYTSKWFGRSSNHLAPIGDNKSGGSSNVSSPRNKFNSADESDDDGYSANETQRMFLIIEMLEKYLKLSSDTEPLNPDGSSIMPNEINSLPVEYDSSAVTSPDNLSPTAYHNFSPPMSPDDQQPGTYHKKYSFASTADSTKSSANASFTSSESPGSYQPTMTWNRASSGGGGYRAIGNQHTSLLLENLRNYGRRNRSSLLSSMDFTPAVLEDKQLLRRIRDELKQQQLECILNRHSRRPLAADTTGLRLSTSLYMLPTLKPVPQRNNVNESKTNVPYPLAPIPTTPNDSSTENVVSPTSRVPLISIKCASQEKPMYNTTEGTQTDPIPVNNIYQYYHEYMKRRKEREEAEKQHQQPQTNTLSKSMSAGGKISISDPSTKHSKRKSSLDNEDVSQSVSDTIKRYLRMARKKPTNDNDANRFKRINYDTNLRNIVPKAEIPKPDELDIGNTKSVQTNDDWSEIVINDIKMQMSANDNKHLPLSDCTEDYQLGQRTISNRKSTSSSMPTSPTGLFHSSTWSKEFLFGGGHKKEEPEPSTNKHSNTYSLNMQKSKSSTNVGQSFTKKIWKSRSKSQTRPDSPAQSHWTPQGNCIWKSSNGNYLQMKKSALHELSEVERKSLQRIALDRINQLNIGVPVKLPLDSAASDGLQPKAPKRRAPLLLKRKALTTGFFDSSKIKSDGRKGSTSNASGGGLIFGQPLEKCLSNDNAFGMATKQKGSDDNGGNGLSHKLSRKSRSSITSLDNQLPISSAISSSDGNYSGSCDSLFSKNDMRYGGSNSADSLSDTGGYPNSLDDDDSKYSSTCSRLQPQVPPLILSCIDHLSTYGLNVVGIFRVSTSKRRIRELREELDSGTLKTFDAETSPHDVASLLKEYLRDLPEPLLCRSLYPAFLSTQKIRNRRLQLEALSHLIQLLPIAHRDTLFVLLKFLAHVARCSDDVINLATNQCISVGNKMDSANLATVIAPNILHSNPIDNSIAVATDDQVEERLDVINVVRTMIDHYEELFSVPADIMDDVYTNMMDSSPEQLDNIFDRRERIDNRKDDSSVSSKRSPSAIQLHTHFFPQHSQERIDSSDLHESSRTGTTTAPNDDTDQPRRMYVREQFTHENTVRGNVAESNDSIIKRRERGSRTKSLIPEHEVFARRRRRDKIPSSSSNNSSPNADDAVRYNLSISQPTTPTSKAAPDQKLNANEIVLASLKLPVQMINQTDILSTVQPLSLTSDLSDIPYIEDSDTNNGYRSTNQSSIAQSASTSSITKNLGQSMKKCSFPLTKLKSQYKPAQLTLTTVPIDQSSRDQDKNVSAKQPSSNIYATEQKTHSVPPMSTGITNIGGDVMRSKTAEFERMLSNQSRQSNQVHYSGRGNESKSIATTTKLTDSSNNSRNGPIYKRRDVISSASNVKK